MALETLLSDTLVDRQREEQAQFLLNLANMLNRAKYHWRVHDRWQLGPNADVAYRGLLIEGDDGKGRGTFLTPSGGVVAIEEWGVVHKWTQDQIFQAVGKGFLKRIEHTVLSTLNECQKGLT